MRRSGRCRAQLWFTEGRTPVYLDLSDCVFFVSVCTGAGRRGIVLSARFITIWKANMLLVYLACSLQLQYRLMTEIWRNAHTLNLNTKVPQQAVTSCSLSPGEGFHAHQYVFPAVSRVASPHLQPPQSPYFIGHPYNECYTSNSNLSTRSASLKQLHPAESETNGSKGVAAMGFLCLFNPSAVSQPDVGDSAKGTRATPLECGVYPAAIVPIGSKQKFYEVRGDADAALIEAISSGVASPVARYRGMPPCLECGQRLLPGGFARGSLVASQAVAVQGPSGHSLMSRDGAGEAQLLGCARVDKPADGPQMFDRGGGGAAGFVASRTSEQLVVFSVPAK